MNDYKNFDNWFNEVENYGTRSERFYDELQSMTPQRAVEWLRAVWDCAQQSKQWQDLTKEEIRLIRKKNQSHDAFAAAIQDELRVKNNE